MRVATASLISWLSMRALQVQHRLPQREFGGQAGSASDSVRSRKSGASGAAAPARRQASADSTRATAGPARRAGGAGSGCSGSRPLPGKSRSVRTPPIWRASTPAARPIVAHRIDRAAQHAVVLVPGFSTRVSWRCSRSRAIAMRLRAKAEHVVAEVELQRLGVDAEEVVLVGAVGQLPARRCGGDARQLGRFLLPRPATACRRIRWPSSHRGRAWSGTGAWPPARRARPG
jgi:hypothetical protein